MRIEKQIFEAGDVQPVVIYGKKDGQDQALPAGIENLGSKSAIYTSVESVCVLLKNLLGLICNFPWVDKSLNRVRSTDIIESGSLSFINSINTVTAVTLVNTVTNLSQVDTLQGRLLINGAQLDAWANCCRRLIT